MSMDKITDEAARLLENINTLTETYGEASASTLLAAARLDAIQTIVAGIVVAVAAAIAIKGILYGSNMLANAKNRARYELGGFAIISVSGLAVVFGTIFALTCLANVTAWVGMFRPEVWLAAKIL